MLAMFYLVRAEVLTYVILSFLLAFPKLFPALRNGSYSLVLVPTLRGLGAEFSELSLT